MATLGKKDARLDFRLPFETKQMIEEAADQLGVSVSGFIVATLAERAEAVIAHHNSTRLSNRDRDVFLSMLDADTRPNEALIAAVERYKKEVVR